MVDRQTLHSKIQQLLEDLGLWNSTLTSSIPNRWEKHGTGIIFPSHSFQDEVWSLPEVEKSLYNLICTIMKVKVVARKSGAIIHNDAFRRPRVELLFNNHYKNEENDGWVLKLENGIKYNWNITKCMFSSGNITEKQRLSAINLSDKVVVDLFAGIGYFTLSFLVHSKAKLVYACEWNPEAVEALKVNLKANKVNDRCIVLEGDNTIMCPKNVADVVNLGLIPSSECSYKVACESLKSTGGVLHVHGNVDTKLKESDQEDKFQKLLDLNYYNDTDNPYSKIPIPWLYWSLQQCDKIQNIMDNLHKDNKQNKFMAQIIKVVRIKSYGPCVDHLVVDIECRPKEL